ncbi:hypothetical protein [Herminiimonas fonticola]|uniref:Uncharacterized protein n=1 Tax=Herminiimonas fonticola TaxID=303380 RepID=A0A4R6G0R0_9BURK|nr:hypothetical protein [Herminiimonas fonticola]RBA24356.1 hypothetical protein Hfont_2168 [Herminiimonas fonticola]TDN87300.1 hypothetical protein EV677_3011 [Herminiimonas fonticola]
MPQNKTEPLSALDKYRAAFMRLKMNTPQRLPKGTIVSQNNVAKEAGTDPSALKKSRFPLFIDEIQRYVSVQSDKKPVSARQKTLSTRKKNRSLQERLSEVAKQRDNLASLLTEADMAILELRSQLVEFQRTASNVVELSVKPQGVRR